MMERTTQTKIDMREFIKTVKAGPAGPASLVLISQHSEMLKSIHDCFFFFGWANEFFALALTDVVVLSFLKSALVLDLGNVQIGNFQTVLFQNVCLYLGIGGSG